MNLRWLFGNFTDPQYKLSLREQTNLSNVAHDRFISRKALGARTALILLPLILFFALLKPMLNLMGWGGQSVPYITALVIAIVLFWPWSAWMYRSLYVGPIRRAMRDAGYDLCIACGYDLRGVDASTLRCSECGSLRELRGNSPASLHAETADEISQE
jgi:hypothetical protein